MKKILNSFLFLLLILIVLLISSCERINSDKDKYEKIYQEKVVDFFNSLKNNDSTEIKSLLSEYVIENDLNLEEDINILMNLFSHSYIELLFTSLTSENFTEEGKRQVIVSSVFPLINDGIYYWIYFDYVCIDEFNSTNIGIKQVNVYTSYEYYMFYHSDNKLIENIGLNLYIESDLKEDIVCINLTPYLFNFTGNVLKFEDVVKYLENNKDISDFIINFGDYNCKHKTYNTYYYEVLYENNIIYLELTCENNQIVEANLYSDREFIRKVL